MKILVIEDNVGLRTLIADYLFEHGFTIDEVGSVEDARAALRAGLYAGMVVDLGLPDGNGISLIRDARGIAILVISGRASTEDCIAGLNAGADDYLPKPFHLAELETRLRAILRRPSINQTTSLSCGSLAYYPASKKVTLASAEIYVSGRECELLETLLNASGKHVSARKIRWQLGYSDSLTSNPVQAVVSRLRRRLRGVGADLSIVCNREVGYKLVATPPRRSQ